MDDDERWLERGWRWLAENAGHPQHAEMEEKWLERLAMYERTYRMVELRGYR